MLIQETVESDLSSFKNTTAKDGKRRAAAYEFNAVDMNDLDEFNAVDMNDLDEFNAVDMNDLDEFNMDEWVQEEVIIPENGLDDSLFAGASRKVAARSNESKLAPQIDHRHIINVCCS